MSNVKAEDLISCGSIYEKLIDDESRLLYRKMLDSYLGNIDLFSFADELTLPAEFTNRGFDKFCSKFSDEAPIVIYGAGCAGLFTYKELLKCDKYRNRAIFICDSDKERIGCKGEIDVKTVVDVVKIKDALFMCCAFRNDYRMEMCLQLCLKYGIDKNRIFFEHPILKKDFKGQYFDVIKPISNEVFFDCGCYDVGTAIDFIKWCKKDYKKIISFEPDNSLYTKCKRIIADNKIENIELIKAGVSDCEGTISFSATSDGSSKITDNGEDIIDVVTIDSVVVDDKPTFIKMDIEGAELAAIKGARSTIKKFCPTLAICVYHKSEDIFNIPRYILELNSKYRFMLRTYTNWGPETVLYAIPDGREVII